jgi:hypothetical protein
MKRAVFRLTLVMCAAWLGLAQVAQPTAPVRNGPVVGTQSTAELPSSGVSSINLGTGELLGATGQAIPSLTPTQRPPSLAGSSITPVQFQNINRLAVELNTLSTPVRDVPAQQQGLIETLQAAPVGQVKPSNEKIARLGNSLAQALPTLQLTAAQRRQLAIDLNLALNSGSLSPGEAERVMADARAVLLGSTASNAASVEQIMGNIGSIVAEAQSNAGHQTNVAAKPASAPTQAGQAGGSQTGQGSGTSSNPNPTPANR